MASMTRPAEIVGAERDRSTEVSPLVRDRGRIMQDAQNRTPAEEIVVTLARCLSHTGSVSAFAGERMRYSIALNPSLVLVLWSLDASGPEECTAEVDACVRRVRESPRIGGAS
jgi:hypothetical protein